MSTKTEGKVPGDELKKLVKEFELLGSREAREEALEYIRFLREELVRGPQFPGSGSSAGQKALFELG